MSLAEPELSREFAMEELMASLQETRRRIRELEATVEFYEQRLLSVLRVLQGGEGE